MKMTRRTVCGLLASASLKVALSQGRKRIALVIRPARIHLETGDVSYRFSKQGGLWAFDSVWARGKKTALPLSRGDSFFLNGGEARDFAVVISSSERKEIRFTGMNGAKVTFGVDIHHLLPRIDISITGIVAPTCTWRTVMAARDQQGAWVTRGEAGTDAESREVFIDGSGRLVFGHSRAGDLDAAYVLQAEVNDNVNRRGKTSQPSDTLFKSGRRETPDGFFGYWQIRIGPEQPKKFGIVFDRDLGGRMHDVCERYYADAVDSQVDLASATNGYDPHLALERMPLRLSCPESLIPGYGWHMEEYFPGYAKASYPYGEDSGIQTAAFLAYEGHATGRDWEKYFGEYVMSQLPLWGEADGKGFFTRRPGGWTRWAYNTDYVTIFPLMEGGNWTDSEHIYRTAVLLGDPELKERALGLMRHDVLVKLNLERMTFPPCWNPLTGKLQDHRDDWETTAALGYCAEVSSEVLYHETQDKKFLQIADHITDWLAAQWGSEVRMNFLHPKVNTFHCFMGPLVRALVHRYERSQNSKFLDIAQDLAWVMILTLGTTAHRDPAGRLFTGVTCVGVRGCVDYDCAPNLCHEKDLPFLEIMGALLPHVNGSGYAKFLAMQKVALPRDSWKDAFHIQEQRDLNLRTNYDNYARGMANLAFALNRGSDPLVAIYERLIPARDPQVRTCRDSVLANGTVTDRETQVQVRFLEPGRYRVELDGHPLPAMSAKELSDGISVKVPKNTMRRLRVTAESINPQQARIDRYDSSITFLSDYPEAAAQRGIGLPTPIFQKDRSFHGQPITMKGAHFEKGLGLAANTVIVYQLNGNFR
ncbi:MAG: NPCBM/NEW2 domain-containing protein, partial [Acidobacteriaceae bacterium]|nr:NPCBM/NEW2 domain-containing protein [Acidobacteriaceae bacterium]